MRHLIESLRTLFVTTWPSAVVALAAWISIVVSIDPAGSYPSMPQGPGLTVDEIFNVEQGVYLVEQSKNLGWLNLVPGTSVEAFRRVNGYNPDHPPLGRYWLGVHHHLTWWIAPPHQPDGPFVTACARTGSATAFALTVWLVGAFVSIMSSSTISGCRTTVVPLLRNCCSAPAVTSSAAAPPGDSARGATTFRNWVGPLAGLSLVLMPRVYGHAHLAALESITNLTCTAAVLAIAAWWSGPAPPTRRAALVAGVVMGLALLTKIQAVLIPVPVIVWSLIRWRQKAIEPLLVWGATALVLFFAMWPYLWLDPVGHLLEYLGRTTNRATLNCFYFGTIYKDKAVPWHYPFVMFAVTVPVGLHALGVLGVKRVKSGDRSDEFLADEWRRGLLLACGLFPLLVFALPKVAVYDGERLFLTVFPLWAIFVGRGAARLLEITARRSGVRLATCGICVVIALQVASNWLVHPCYLSYYNLAVGGLSGAEKLGLEMNYWGDGITRSLLEEAVAEHGGFTHVEIRPSLHQFQNDDLLRQSPILRQRRLTDTDPRRGRSATTLRFAFRRRADLSDDEFLKYHHGKGGPGFVAAYERTR